MERNIKVGYVYNFFTYFNITAAIWVLYLSYKGMSLIQIGLLESIYHITGFLCEIPTGAFADIYGRRKSVIAGRILSGISSVIMIYSNSFSGFAIAFILSALSMNLNSGANESIIYDSLKLLGKEEEYKKIYGTMSFFMEIAQAMAVLFGGILSDIRFVYAYILALSIDIISLTAAAFYKEPPFEAPKHQGNVLIGQIKESMSILQTRKFVFYLIVFYALLSTADATVYFYGQKYFENMNFSRTAIAMIFALNIFFSALWSKSAYYIESKLKMSKIIMLFPILNVLTFIGLAFVSGYPAVCIFMISSFTNGAAAPIFSDYINSLIPSEYRATLLSFSSLCYSVSMLLIFPLAGFLGEKWGLPFAFVSIGLAFIPGIIIIMQKLNSHRLINDEEDLKNDSISFE